MPEKVKKSNRRVFLATALLFAFAVGVLCQRFELLNPVEEGVKSIVRPLYVKKWPKSFAETAIIASADQSIQKAMTYRSTKTSAPLVVSLHTWSGNWATPDPLAPYVKECNWNYIHPDFRGPNIRPEACLGPAVVSDINDAISFGLKEFKADPGNVVVIGMSGGGHAALGHLLSSDGPPVKLYSVWCPVTDVRAWFFQLKARGLDTDLVARCCCDGKQKFDPQVAIDRSPLHMDFDQEKLARSKLLIHAGVLDGITGTVHYSHSIDFFNRCCDAMGQSEQEVTLAERVSISKALDREWKRHETVFSKGGANGSLNLFFGHHEYLPKQAIVELERAIAGNNSIRVQKDSL